LGSGGGGEEDLSAQVAGFSRRAKGAGENWPNSHIFPPFLTLPLWDFFRQGWRKGTQSNREISEQRDQTKIRGVKFEIQTRKMLAFTTLKKGSPAFCRKPLRQNVRLLFASCSLIFLFYFFKIGPRDDSGRPPAVDGGSRMAGKRRIKIMSKIRIKIKSGIETGTAEAIHKIALHTAPSLANYDGVEHGHAGQVA
jgi:hypothetical protein